MRQLSLTSIFTPIIVRTIPKYNDNSSDHLYLLATRIDKKLFILHLINELLLDFIVFLNYANIAPDV